MKTKFIFSIFFIFSLFACQEVKYAIIEKDDLQSVFKLNSSASFKGYFYLGTADDFHFFMEKWNLKEDKNFKIKIADLKINKINKLGEESLLISLIETNRKFGSNEYCQLFYVLTQEQIEKTYNKKTGIADLDAGLIQIIQYGEFPPYFDFDQNFAKEHRFQFIRIGCEVSKADIKNIQDYNQVMSDYLAAAYGEEWRKELEEGRKKVMNK